MSSEHPTPHELGYRVEYRRLRICGTCFHLYEEGRRDGMNQHCRCLPDEGPLWPTVDYNQRAALCACCATELLHSGSRWSEYFCRECQLLAMGVSLWEGRLVFPIGRHSIMHGWVPRDRSPRRNVTADVARALKRIAGGSDVIFQWYPVRVDAVLRQLGLEGGVPVREYLAAVSEAGLPFLRPRTEAFRGMCRMAMGAQGSQATPR
jgi:hypothetical protein